MFQYSKSQVRMRINNFRDNHVFLPFTTRCAYVMITIIDFCMTIEMMWQTFYYTEYQFCRSRK